MIKVALVRGKYLNNFEGQNYVFDNKTISLTGISSFRPLHTKFPFPVIKLLSLADIGDFHNILKFTSNRILGDSQILYDLESLAQKFDIFHTGDPHYYYSYQLSKLRKKHEIKKLIVTSWETIPYNNETAPRKKFIKYFTLRQADRFICYTEKARQILIHEGVNEQKISVIKLGVDLNRFKYQKSIPIKSGQKDKSKIKNLMILFVGRLVEEKGVMDLYKMFLKLKTTTQNLKLKIVGSSPLKAKLIKMIKKDRLNNFITIEHKSYEDMPEVYQNADILVLPSKRTKTWEEQYGMVLIEAMATGLPIVAYNTGAISEVVGSSGLLVEQGDIDGFVGHVLELVNNYSLRLKLGRMGRDRAEKEYDKNKTAKKIEEVYLDIV